MNLFSIFRKKEKLDAPWEKYYKKEELNFDIPDISLYEQILNTKEKYPTNTAIVYEGRKFKFSYVLNKIDKVADSFCSIGIKKDDIVTILLPNIPECLYSFYALNKIGAIACMTHPLSAVKEIEESISTTKSKYLIVYDALYNKVKDIALSLCIKKVILVSPASSLSPLKSIFYKISNYKKIDNPNKSDMVIYFNKLYLMKIDKEFSYPKLGKNTKAVILHSGGTSGKSKNVVIQNRAFILAAKGEEIDLVNLKQGDSALAIMPNFHGFGLSVLMHTPLTLGCATILVPKFNAKKFASLLKKTKPTCILGVPTLFEALVNSKNMKNINLSFLKYIISGGDFLSKNLEDRVNLFLKNHNSNIKITQGYGLSEALACVTMAHDDVNKSGSVGIPLCTNHIKIIDPVTRKKVEKYIVGEIMVQSRALMLGYLNDEKETLKALEIMDDGYVWLHTGDLGYLDEDGFLFYKGRIKRMIVTSGYNVYPTHVEEVIERHPSVMMCSVIGVPNLYKGEVLRAYIVLNPGYNRIFAKIDILNHCKKNLARYMIPSEVVFRTNLPRTKLGKIDFKKLQNDICMDDIEKL